MRNTAVTWYVDILGIIMVKLIIEIGGRSVVGRFVQSTFWPTLVEL